ncbi:glycosyltransferase family 1 protein [Anaerospora sp.]|uniref:glycosyltransferase family 4 protein n=1 Tax=Anaerospora sp. TaxID=1960278 RepID=UPI0028A17882|nr:glycosyltransferase family 1 protein [Anaerospora sp.]
MIIGIDARLINGERRGMGNVLYNILLHLPKFVSREIILYFDREINVELKGEMEELGYKLVIINGSNYLIWEQFLLPKRVKQDNITLFWHPYNTGSLFLSCSQVVSIHDVMYMKPRTVLPYSKSSYQILGRIYRKYNTPQIARKAERIITISHHAKDDIVSEIKNIDSKIEVVYNGCNKSLGISRDLSQWNQFKTFYNINDKYMLCLGATEPRKNTVYTIEVFGKFIKKHGLDIQLVICGLKNWHCSAAYDRVKELDICKNVVFLDYVPGEVLDLLYINAYIFLFLSYYEGFGLPILEAMAFNTPVVTTNVTSMPEIAGNAAIITAHNDERVTLEAVEKLYFNEQLYAHLVEKGQNRIKLFTWERSAAKVANILADHCSKCDEVVK